MTVPILEAKSIVYSYPDGTPALNGVSLSLGAGEKIALVGANGSGKTTLLLILSGALAPRGGEILLRGEDVSGRASALNKAAGLVFQDPDDQLFMPTVAEDAAFGLVSKGVPAREARDAAVSCLESLGARRLAARPPHRMSGGEKRIAALAGILVTEPEILILDEPTSGLDPAARRNIVKTLENMDSTMLIGTHDLDMALGLCDRVLVMHGGAITAKGAPKEILTDGALMRKNGLDLPLRYSESENL
ncbi:MAG: energy-coupling factor ABC transporter ATP-binding protein [Synergistaceae bacterium]|nr:energy-coupling factor ABC transporter ATP-binding protein [Synergistaceae bacterium]